MYLKDHDSAVLNDEEFELAFDELIYSQSVLNFGLNNAF